MASPEPLIDFTSGNEEDASDTKRGGPPPAPPKDTGRSRPPPPPPSSSKPKFFVRSNTTSAVGSTQKPVMRHSLPSGSPPTTKKPLPPPKPKNRNSEIFAPPKSQMVSHNDKPPRPLSVSLTAKPVPPPRQKSLEPVSIHPERLTLHKTRASDSPISPIPGTELALVRETPTIDGNDRQLHFNGEGLLIDFTESNNSKHGYHDASQSHSSSSTGKSTGSSRKGQPVCLPRLSTREFDYEEREHSRNVFKQLHDLMLKEELCDALLIAGDKEVKAHRVVLSANSPYFRDMFIGEFSEPDGVPIEIEEVDEDSLSSLIQFAYTSRIKLTQSNVYKLFEAADVLQFQGVKNACFRFFRSQMNKSNCIRTWMFAESHNCTELLEASLKFIEVNFLDIVRGNEFLNIESETVSRIVSLEDIAITCEEQVYDAVIGWINHNKEERHHDALQVLQNVRFPSMNKDYLLHIVDHEDIIINEPDCLSLLIDALQAHVPSERGTLSRQLKKQGSKYLPRSASMAVEEVELPRGETSLGVAIMGGADRPTHVFRQGDKPGIFIREVISGGAAAKSGKLRAGDRILSINGQDTSNCYHDAAIRLLLTAKDSLKLLVRHEPPPKGLKEITLVSKPGGGFGFSIGGGVNGEPVNPYDDTDEGIFITQIIVGGASEQDGRLTVGTRILQVNSVSLLGKTLDEALKILHEIVDRMSLLVCQGFDPSSTPGHSESGSITSWGEESQSEGGAELRSNDSSHGYKMMVNTGENTSHIYDHPPN